MLYKQKLSQFISCEYHRWCKVSMLTSSVVDRGLEPRSCQNNRASMRNLARRNKIAILKLTHLAKCVVRI